MPQLSHTGGNLDKLDFTKPDKFLKEIIDFLSQITILN